MNSSFASLQVGLWTRLWSMQMTGDVTALAFCPLPVMPYLSVATSTLCRSVSESDDGPVG